MRIALIGAGWYGLHLARHFLKSGHEITIFERKGIFAGASGNNQDRVHLGFHYPRSAKTRSEIRYCHDRFIRDYPTVELKNNVYAISNKSSIDFPTYLAICKSADLEFEEVDPKELGLVGVEGAVLTHERVVDTAAVKKIFQEELSAFVDKREVRNIQLRTDGVVVEGERFDACLNCTNIRLADPTLQCYYEAAMILNLRGPAGHPSFTIMDGNFPTLLETTVPGEYTCSHVIHTAIAKCETYNEAQMILDGTSWEKQSKLFIKSIKEYVPWVAESFTVTGCRKAVRTKPLNNTDSRECLTSVSGRLMTIVCGKFMSCYIAQERIDKWMQSLGAKVLSGAI